MAMNIKFDLMGNPEPSTIILANRNGNKLGQLNVNAESIDASDKFNDASELSFTLNKYIDGELTPLWDKVVDFKLVYCKEWDEWFEIKVELDEATETVKTVFCTQLGQAELSQIMLYNIEINTDIDIERDDYKISILYDADDPEASILHRVLKDKAPHYTIAYVSPTIAKKVRNFSFDGTSIYDAFREIAEELGCLFLYYASINEDGVLERRIAVHDLQQTCNNESCGYRGEFTDKCPKCGGTDITNGYGEDTLIFVTSDELASEGIQLTTDTDSVKNCFKLEGGDDLMTATIRNCNPNGTDYIWYFSDSMKEDMSEELVHKIESYDEKYKEFYNERVSNLDTTLLNNYNALVDKYSIYNEDLQKISSPIKGYPALMNAYYNTIDLALYLKSGLMPSVDISDPSTCLDCGYEGSIDEKCPECGSENILTGAKRQSSLLTAPALSPIAVEELTSSTSLSTLNSVALGMAKTIVKSTYQVKVKGSEKIVEDDKVYWKGNFIITNYSDDEDTAESEIIKVLVNDDTETFVKQMIDKELNKENIDDYSISGLFEKEHDAFREELKKYALNPLISFYDAGQSCIDILIKQGVPDNNTWGDATEGSESNLYEKLYLPYYNKLLAIDAEKALRESEINLIVGVYDSEGDLITEGLQTNIEECRNAIQAELNFETYLGETLWLEFCAYRREDKYSNDNYISDGLNNAEVFEKALEFIDVAENEIYKSSELQHSISTTLNNLLAIPKFKPLADSFKTGNWIRVQVDDKVHKLRLLEYDISFGDFNTISVEFSDVTKIKNGTTDVQDVFAQASSMATSYSSVQRQANQGDRAKTTLEEWISDGLNSANVQIQSNDSEDITLTKHGLLCRSYDDVTQTYSPEQLKLTHNIMAYTDDNWKTVRQAIGKHEYKYFDKKEANDFVKKIGYGVTSDFLDAGIVSGSQIIGGDVYSDNYSITNRTGSYLNLRDGTFSFGGGSLRYEDGKLIISSKAADTNITEVNEEWLKTTSVYAENLQVNAAEIQNQLTAKQINTEGLIAENISATTIEGKTIEGGSLLIGDKETDTYAEISPDGKLTCINADITGTITATNGTFDDGTFNNCTINEDCTIKGKLEGAEGTFSGTVSGATIEGGSLLIGNKDDGYGAWISDEDYIFHAYGAVIEGDSTFSGTITASDIVGKSTLKVGEYEDEDGNTCYLTWISDEGVLNAQGAVIEGELHVSENSTIAGFNVTNADIHSGTLGNDESVFLSTINMNGVGGFFEGDSIIQEDGTITRADDKINNWRMTVGSNFGVTSNGFLYANDASIRGDITATSGKFANCIIDDSCQLQGSNSTTVITSQGLQINSTQMTQTNVSYHMGAGGSFMYTGGASSAIPFPLVFGTSTVGVGTGTTYMNANGLYVGTDGSVSLHSNSQEGITLTADNGDILLGALLNLTLITEGTGELSGTWKLNGASISTSSDKNLKHNISPLDDNYSKLFDGLKPMKFKYNNGTSNRYHTGFIAQDVCEATINAALTTKDFAAYVEFTDEEGKAECGLRYEEFIALNTWQIQQLKKRVEELEIKLKVLNK